MVDLSVRGLTVSYGSHEVLHNVNFDAPGGLVTGVIGPNGGGKSTLLKAIVGLVPLDHGTLTLGDRSTLNARRQIAYMEQTPGVSWHYPAQVRDVVGMGRYTHRRWRRLKKVDQDVIVASLRQVGMENLATKPISELSGGQRQRALVARALAQEAVLIMLDEPFAALDPGTISLLCRVLRQTAALGASVVVVNHDISVMHGLCDRVVLIAQRVLVEGPAKAVVKDDLLSALYGAAPSRNASSTGCD